MQPGRGPAAAPARRARRRSRGRRSAPGIIHRVYDQGKSTCIFRQGKFEFFAVVVSVLFRSARHAAGPWPRGRPGPPRATALPWPSLSARSYLLGV